MLESPGVQGFVNSARKEPKGDNIRGVLNWDTDCSLAELIERSSRLDMANNCFKQGIHGAYISLDAAVRLARSPTNWKLYIYFPPARLHKPRSQTLFL